MITSIGQFLDNMGVYSRIFDMGRHINELPSQHFQSFEAGQTAYPAPYLHHAWIGLLFWEPDAAEIPSLWFLKLPLDEQGKLDLGARDLFLKQLLTAVGSNIEAVKEGKQLQAVLEGNPFVFTPTPERQASLHAKVKTLLQLPPSSHYQACRDYLQGNDLQHWDTLAVQGFADVAVRFSEHQSALINSIPNLPSTPLKSLALCLESEPMSGALCKVIGQRLQLESSSQSPDADLMAALIRSISRSQAVELRQKLLLQLLSEDNTQTQTIECLAAIATRCHLDLTNHDVCSAFLESLALHSQDTFNRVLTDLLFLPAIRPHLMACFRDTSRSPQLASAIGGLIQATPAQNTSLH